MVTMLLLLPEPVCSVMETIAADSGDLAEAACIPIEVEDPADRPSTSHRKSKHAEDTDLNSVPAEKCASVGGNFKEFNCTTEGHHQ